jgi:hypothetical protein
MNVVGRTTITPAEAITVALICFEWDSRGLEPADSTGKQYRSLPFSV